MKDFINREAKLGCVLSPLYVPLGGVISYLIMAAVMLSFDDAFSVLAISIICTAGISLILWIPIWYLLGYLAIAGLRVLLHLFGVNLPLPGSKKKEERADMPPDEPVLSRDQLALLTYIKKARAKGLPDTKIEQNLQANGWSGESISAAFQMA